MDYLIDAVLRRSPSDAYAGNDDSSAASPAGRLPTGRMSTQPPALIDTPATPEPLHGTMPAASVPRSDTTPAIAVPNSRPPQLQPAPTTPCSAAVQAALDQAGAAAEQLRLRTVINDQAVAAERAQLHAAAKF